jgi:hypothetical protein
MIHIHNNILLKDSSDTSKEDMLEGYIDLYLLEGQSLFKRTERRNLGYLKLHDILSYVRYERQDVQTSKSYGHDITAWAISNTQIGIDIELINPDFDYQEISKEILSETEFGHLEPLGALKFFKSWTRKEAILKSMNSGLINELQLIPSIDGDHNFPCLDLFKNAVDLYVYSFEYKNHLISVCSSAEQEYIRLEILRN